jgi:para-nitrobenzyl esterase
MKALPVFVWIHGGALRVGQGADYDPSKLADKGNVIVVSLNYRLGLFGFFAHPAIDHEGHPFANYGLMDQQAALRWVQRNISAFGGDPGDVTIAGESAGGISVMMQIVSPLAAGTFRNAIAMSGARLMARHPAFRAVKPVSVAEELGSRFSKAVGCSENNAACLRALPTKRILDAQSPYLLNEAIIDGIVIPMHPSDAFRTGQINRVTLVNGSTHDEGRFFVALTELMTGKAMSADDYTASLNRQFGERLAAEVAREYALEGYNTPGEAFAAAATDSMFACPALAMDRLLTGKIPLYAYEFNDGTAPSYVGPTTFPLLAAHTYELAYVFPGFHGGADAVVKLNSLQEKLSDEMVNYFTSLSQMSSREAEWPRFDPRQENMMTFILPTSKLVSGRFSDFHHCTFWDRAGIY